MERLKVASLFCGCGGTDIGIEGGFSFLGKSYPDNQMDVVYANDFEKSACDIFMANFNINVDNRDIRDVQSDEIPDFEILTGGFPCQSFSVIAQNPKRLGIKDDKGKLFFEMCRIIKEKQPKIFVAENVKGILSANRGEAFPLIIEEFEKCGYKVKHQVLKAVEFGVPQKRERVIVVGVRNDIKKEYIFPTPISVSEQDYVPLKVVLSNNVDERYFFSSKAVDGMMRKRSSMNKGRAQDIDMPCNTVGSHLAKVSLNSTDPVLFVKSRFRRFTPREVARIQSFPEDFILFGSEGAQYKALGNAIPPVMFWYIGKSINDLLAKGESD